MENDNNILVDWEAFENNPSKLAMLDEVTSTVYGINEIPLGKPMKPQEVIDIVGPLLGTNNVKLYPLDKLEQYRWRGGVSSGGRGFAAPLSTPSRLQVLFTFGSAKGLTEETMVNALTIYDNIVANTGDSRLGMMSIAGIFTELINNDESGNARPKQLNADNVDVFKQSFFANDIPYFSESDIKSVQRVFDIGTGINVSTPKEVASQIKRGMSGTLIAPEDMMGNWYEAMDQAINEKIENVLLTNNLASGTDAQNLKNLAMLTAEIKEIGGFSNQTRFILNELLVKGDVDTADLTLIRINEFIKANPKLIIKGEHPMTLNNPDYFKNTSPINKLIEDITYIDDEEMMKKVLTIFDEVNNTSINLDSRFIEGTGSFENSSKFKEPYKIIEEHLEAVYQAIDEAAVRVVNGTTTYTPKQLNNEIKILENRLGDIEEYAEFMDGYLNEYKPLTGQEDVFPYLVLDETGDTPFSYEAIEKAFNDSEMFGSLDNIIGQTIIDNEMGRGVVVGIEVDGGSLDRTYLDILFDEEVTWGQAEPRRFFHQDSYNLSHYTKRETILRKIREGKNYYKKRLDPNVFDLTRDIERSVYPNFNVQTGEAGEYVIESMKHTWKTNEFYHPGKSKWLDGKEEVIQPAGTIKSTDTYKDTTIKRPLSDYFISDPDGYLIIDSQSTNYGHFNGDANMAVSEMSDAEMQLQDIQKKEYQQFLNEMSDDNVTDIRDKQLEKLLNETADEPPVSNLTASQTELIDNALDDARAQLSRAQFRVVDGGKRHTIDEVLGAAGKRLGKIFADGLTLLDIYELGLLAYAFGEPVVDMITKVIYPDLVDDASYKEKLFANIEMTAKYSPTEKLIKKVGDEYEYITGVRPSEVFNEITQEDTSPVRESLTLGKDEDMPSTTQKEIEEAFDYDMSRFETNQGTNPEEYNQFLKGMRGMIGGNDGR